MSTNDMRGHIIAAYPGEEWKRKIQKMSEPQLLAIYKRLKAKDKCK